MKKRFLLIAALIGFAMNIQAETVKAPTYTEWHDMEVNNVNRLPVHTTFFAFENEQLALKGDMTKSSCIYLYVNGQPILIKGADRKECMLIAKYGQSADEQFFPYLTHFNKKK